MGDYVNKQKLSITLDKEIVQFITELAEKDDRSFSSMLNVILRDYKRSVEEKG